MMNKKTEGQIITFYSYKGGTGRSMALANVACQLALTSRVLAIDWDLDAPGLSQYFRNITDAGELARTAGVLEFFENWTRSHNGKVSSPEQTLDAFRSTGLADFTIKTNLPQLSFMPHGRTDPSYSNRLVSFSWEVLNQDSPGLFSVLATYLAEEFDYVLIDSRSGFSDIAGICTTLLPEKLVAVFTPNRQNLEGLQSVVRRAIHYRKHSDDIRPLTVFPLVSRVEASEPRLLEEWRSSRQDLGGRINGYQSLFEDLFKELYGLTDCNLSAYFDEIQIQHVPRYSYGEEIAVLTERQERLSLSRSFGEFSQFLTTQTTPWDARPSFGHRKKTAEQELESVDQKWFDQQRDRAEQGLRSAGFEGFAEIRASILRSRPNVNQATLLDATRQSLIHTFGWPIGVILEGQPDRRPRPTSDGIYAEVPTQVEIFGGSYDFWAWRRNGDFFLLQSLFEDRQKKATHLFLDTRIVRLTETLLYCSQVYKRLGVPGDAPIQLKARWGGLKGRKLGAASPIFIHPRETIENEVASSVEIPLTRIPVDLVGVVKQLLDPLFIVFDFAQFSEQIYRQSVDGFVSQTWQIGQGFRADMEHLRLEAEQTGQGWIARVYDLRDHTTIFETETSEIESAKKQAVSFALLTLGSSGSAISQEELAARLTWSKFSPVGS